MNNVYKPSESERTLADLIWYGQCDKTGGTVGVQAHDMPTEE